MERQVEAKETQFGAQEARTFTRRTLDQDSVRAFMRQVYTTMMLGLLITGMAAWYVSQSPGLLQFFYSGIIKWIVMFAPLGLVIFLAARINKMSYTQASVAFATYSLVNGISLAFIFVVFEIGVIWNVFLITAATFGAMALVGLTTKTDLTKLGSILYMALIGLIIAMVVNWFMESSTMQYIISIIGVLLFCGLTAYDNQKLMEIGATADPEAEGTRKIAVMGALALYLDFINLFLFILQIFGGSND